MAMDLWQALASNGSSRSSLHAWDGRRFESSTWSDVVRDAEAMTHGLRGAGVRRGETVAAVLTNHPAVVRGMLAVWLAGGRIASLPVPARGMDQQEYALQLSTICAKLAPVAFLIDERMLGLLPADLSTDLKARSWESFAGSGRVEPAPLEQEEVAFIQYSSGSTSEPKGCMLTPRAIAAQLEMVWRMVAGEAEHDVTASWLPLSHDMGLFGLLLTPWAHDSDLYLSTPERFMLSPRSWFGDMAEVGATMTAGTNTGLFVAARAYQSQRLRRELKVKVCILGAERIEWETLRYAVQTLGPYGFCEQALMPAYGLAEATLAVCATAVDEPPRHTVLDVNALAEGELLEVDEGQSSATRMVSAGAPCSGVTLPDSRSDAITEIKVCSPSLASGYFAEESRTRDRFFEGAVLTGDLGFTRDGQLYPVGRLDDVISVAGRKVYAREIELAVDGLKGVRRGCSALVERRSGGARLTLCIEVSDARESYRSLARQAASVAMDKAAVALEECIFLERGTLPKTPSGKIQRHRARRMLEGEHFDPLARVALADG